MKPARTVPPRPEPANPHGWLGYVVADRDRTKNVVRLARWLVLAAVLALAIVAGALVAIALVSPPAAAALFAGFTTVGGVTLRRRSRRSPGPGTRRQFRTGLGSLLRGPTSSGREPKPPD
jgi:uncharacterized membrane protein YphA (DoxX/SURF4 family)